ncbi:MAG TPA: hypothetical protein VMT32_08105, partial [Bryobacteraceae bacterium]|nr:hypothetical protein [Bryobacteraceae bacterium]
MAINFIPNDPLAIDFVPIRKIEPRPDRTARVARLTIVGDYQEGVFSPGKPESLFWQCREAALLTIEVWEQLNGSLKKWCANAVNPRRLTVIPNGGDCLNAYYDREHLAFFHHTTRDHTTFSGASTDVVAHELGHAFLDVLRPELFGSPITEYAAFHEAFSDCIAILVALFDRDTRSALLNKPADRPPDNPTSSLPGVVAIQNFVETTAEDLSDGVLRANDSNHPASAPRHALNEFQFQLPTIGPPARLTSEPHSFARIFTGCFYDLIRNIFNKVQKKDEAALLNTAQTAGKLLIEAAKRGDLQARFFQSVGRAMVTADIELNAARNQQEIEMAFRGHGIRLGGALMPQATLAGSAPRRRSRSHPAALEPATLK